MTSGPSALVRRTDPALAQSAIAVWTMVLLFSGQGFRHLLGLPLYSALSVLTVAAVIVSFRDQLPRLKVPFMVGAFVGLATLSIAWSATREVTVLAVAVLVVTTLIAILISRGTGGARFMVLLFRSLQISLFGGLAFELFVALVIRHPVSPLVNDLARLAGGDVASAPEEWSEALLFHGGPIQGFVGNRNPFGAIALFAAIIAVVVLLERRISRIDAVATVAIAGLVHLLTLSATVSAAALFVIALAIGALIIRAVGEPLKRPVSFAVLACATVAAVLTLKYRDAIFAMLDRDSDLTNRTEIWKQVILFAERRPEGWGFVGYWPVWEDPYESIIDTTALFTSHGHNAFLDAWMQVGLVGMVLLIVIMALLFGSAWRLVERAGRGDTFVPLGWALLTAALALQALTESRLLVESGWFLVVALYCMGPPVFRLTIVDPDMVHYGQASNGKRGSVRDALAAPVKRAL